ncbi:MAG: hypothetical protein QGH20_04185, partial [Candidatus Latescibacteria bacterium]|nr:hypothetical protein [Candidatus Latescibacterota bacterium]
MEQLSIVQDWRASAVIVVPTDASTEVSETAHDLSDIIATMSGAALPVVSRPGDGPALVLGLQDQD